MTALPLLIFALVTIFLFALSIVNLMSAWHTENGVLLMISGCQFLIGGMFGAVSVMLYLGGQR